MLADELDFVVGVDPHRDSHALAVVDVRGGAVVFETTVVANSDGYAEALKLADVHAPWSASVQLERILRLYVRHYNTTTTGRTSCGSATPARALPTQTCSGCLRRGCKPETEGRPRRARGSPAIPGPSRRRSRSRVCARPG